MESYQRKIIPEAWQGSGTIYSGTPESKNMWSLWGLLWGVGECAVKMLRLLKEPEAKTVQ